MAITINGTGSITGLTAGGLPDGSVTAADIETSLDLTGKTVTLPSGTGGKILQVVSVVKTDTYVATASSTAALITGMQASITPSSTSSKILITICLSAQNGDAYLGHHGILRRNGTTDICIGDSSGSNNRATFSFQPPAFLSPNATLTGPGGQTIVFLDSPATTSSTTYGLYHKDTSGAGDLLYVNRSRATGTGTEYNRTASTITLMEVSA